MRALAVFLWCATALAHPALGAPPEVQFEYSNPGMTPAHWTLSVRPDGSGHFHAERGHATADGALTLNAAEIDRDVQVSPKFAGEVFAAAERHNGFRQECESHWKVAFTGTKTLRFSSPESQGACSFNFSKDKEIEALGDEMVAVGETLVTGARLELLLQHDRLGLDAELEALMIAAQEGRSLQLCAIREILQRLSEDPAVMERVHKRARVLLERAAAEI